MVRRINFFAGPGSGKSTTAAWLFSELKTQRGINVELITEYVKNWTYYADKSPQSFDQLYLLGKQAHAEDRALREGKRSGVNVVVTDSPLYQVVFYAKCTNQIDGLWKSLKEVADRFEQHYPSLNIFLSRGSRPYNPMGRWQTQEEASLLDDQIKSTLIDWKVPFVEVPTQDRSLLLESVTEALKNT